MEAPLARFADAKVRERTKGIDHCAVDSGVDQETEFQVHRKDGSIERSDSHGNDPNPPKDKP